MGTQSSPPALVADRLGKTFANDGRTTRALEELSFAVAAGELVTIIGPSGCGKSTLLRLIGGLLDVGEGALTVDGTTPTEGRRSKRFGFVPQSPALLPWRTVRQNLTLLPDLHRRRGPAPDPEMGSDAEIERLLTAVGLDGFADALPHELSGGMQQRVSLARAFALRPPVLLMDEPFAALDEITRAKMRYLLLDLWRDTQATVLFVTHSIDEAVLLSDRVLVLTARPGRLAMELPIDLSRPRQPGVEDDDDFHRYAAELRAALDKATNGEGDVDL